MRALPEGRHRIDGNLYLKVAPKDRRSWSIRYTSPVTHRQREMGLGTYAFSRKDVGLTLSDALNKAAEVRINLLMRQLDPLVEEEKQRAAALAAANTAAVITFEAAARALVEAKQTGWTPSYAGAWMQPLRCHAFPTVGERPVADIHVEDVLAVLQPIWSSHIDTARLVAQRIRMILDFAASRRWRDHATANPAIWTGNLQHLLPAPKVVKRKNGGKQHQAAMDWRAMPKFWRELAQHDSVSAECLRWTVLNSVRSKEARLTDVSHIFVGNIWKTATKTKRAFEVPLSAAAMEILHRLKPMSKANGNGSRYLFGGQAHQKVGRERQTLGSPKHPPLADRAMLALINRMIANQSDQTTMEHADWYDPETGRRIVVHGFRAVFRTWATDGAGAPRWLAELALSHQQGNETERAYDRASAIEGRRALHEAWAEYLQTGTVKLFRNFVTPELMMRLADVAR